MITLKQIDYALAVAKNLHFKKAADECFISPSTLSNAITELEAHLGVQIFERTNKKVLVTTLGKEILAKAKLIKMEVNSINDLAQSYSNAQPISLGIIPTVSPYFLPLMLPKIEKKLPAINLKIEESQSNSLVQKVSDGELDIAILALPYDTRELKCYKFWEEDFYWVSHAKDINASEREREARDHRSRGRELAEGIEADADRQKTVIEANAYREAEQIRGEGDAIAAEIYANAFNQDPEFYSFHRSIQAYKNSFAGKEDLLVIDPESDFFRYLKDPTGK